jgi:hypothetical protein
MYIDKRYRTVGILFNRIIKTAEFKISKNKCFAGGEFYNKKEAYKWANDEVNKLESQGHEVTKVIITRQISIRR